jgi:hypothetical protein
VARNVLDQEWVPARHAIRVRAGHSPYRLSGRRLAVVVVSYSGKEINAKLVYYGMGLSGKTTNLESIYEAVPETSRGKMVSMKTQSDRTLFFDLLPLDLGEVLGFKTRFLLYTVPGQVFYNATRKLVLKGADAVVFVADSERGKMDENKESLSNLRANLAEYKVNIDDIPWVIQYNKRDLPDVYAIEELERELNPSGVPYVEAVATQGRGVRETFDLVSKMLLDRVTKDLKRQSAGRSERPATTPASQTAMATAGASPAAAAPSRAVRFPTPATDAAPARETARESPRDAKNTPPWNASAEPAYGRDINLGGEKNSKNSPFGVSPIAPAPALAPARTATRELKATADSSGEMTIPVRLGRGERLREITLRIVVEMDEAA